MEDIIWNCIIKRLADNETQVSKEKLDAWLSEEGSNLEKYQEIKQLWELTTLLPREQNEHPLPFSNYIINDDASVKTAKGNKNRFYRFGIAASLIGALSFAIYQYNAHKRQPRNEEFLVKKTGLGQLFHFVLPDSSKVWLNAGSEVKFSVQFSTTKIRKVYLRGEAYFEVKHDSLHPFVVESSKLITTVYGTSFSVRAYPEDVSSVVAVNTGKVGVRNTNIKSSSPVFLLPTDQLLYNSKLNQFSRSTLKNEDVNSWIKGDLIFEQTPLTDVFETLSRKFNVRFNVGQHKYNGCKLTATFRNQALTTILKTLGTVMNIKSNQIDQTIYVEGGDACN